MERKVWMITGARGLRISRFGRIDVLVNNAGKDVERIYQVQWAAASVASDG